MTTRPWMPLSIADYLRDTAHLRALESGAYLHLIMAYWVSGGLPRDDRQLATVAKLSDKEWKAIKPVLAPFFGPDFQSHKRIDAELKKTAEVSAKRRAAAEQRHSKPDANAGANGHTLHTTHSVPKGTGAPAPLDDPKAELFARGRKVLGKDAGGLIAKLLKSFGNEDDPKAIAKARARIEEASTKAAPGEWLGRVLAPNSKPFQSRGGIEGIV